jgi:hypothetical protein
MKKRSPMVYQERITVKILPLIMVPLIVFILIISIFNWELISGIIIFITIIILIIVSLIFGALQIECDNERLWVHWGPMGKKIPLKDIVFINSTIIHPFRDYLGWGLRVGRDGSIGYISSGDVGVRVSLTDGKEYVITSNDPEKLVDYVRKYR